MVKPKTENTAGVVADTGAGINSALELGQNYLEASASGSEKIFKWNTKKLQSAFLLSLDKYNNSDISKALHIAPQTLAKWKKQAEFIKKVNEFILTTGLSDKVRRVSGQKNILEKIETILLDKLNNTAELRFIKPTPLLSKYYQGIQELRKDTEAGAGGVGSSGGRSINLIAIINNMQSGNKAELKKNLKEAVIEAIKRKRGVLGINNENIIEAVASVASNTEAGNGNGGQKEKKAVASGAGNNEAGNVSGLSLDDVIEAGNVGGANTEAGQI